MSQTSAIRLTGVGGHHMRNAKLILGCMALLAATSIAQAAEKPAKKLITKCTVTCEQAHRICLKNRVADKSNFDCDGQLTSCGRDGWWRGPHAVCRVVPTKASTSK